MAEQYPELWIIEAREGYNLDTNPSWELGATTGCTAVGASTALAAVSTQMRRGYKSMEITPTTSAESGFYKSFALSSGSAYAWSMDVRGVAGQTYSMYFANTSGVAQGTTTSWTDTGRWARHVVTHTAGSAATFRVYCTRASTAGTTAFYVDGSQFEAGTVTTYFDGDSDGPNPTRNDYIWTGLRHASISYRSPKTRSGGSLLRVRDYAKILGISGMGLPPVTNNAIPIGLNGSQYQSSRIEDRELVLYLRFYGATTDAMRDNRAAISRALENDGVPGPEPVVLRWQLQDTSGNPASEILELDVLYSGGLEDDTSQPASQIVSKAAVTFTAYRPLFRQDGESGVNLGAGGTVSPARNLVYRTSAGQWTSAGSIALGDTVYTLAQGGDGYVYAGGAFDAIAGVGTSAAAAYWNGAVWTGMGLGNTSYSVRAIAIAPDGYPVIGGVFGTTAAGSTLNNVAKWNGTNLTPLGTTGVTGTANTVFALCYDDLGNLYAAGNFGTAGTAAVAGVAKFDGTNWTAMGTNLTTGGVGQSVVDSLAAQGTNLYAVRTSNLTGYSAIYRWDGTTWETIGTPAGQMYALLPASDGKLYAAGNYDHSVLSIQYPIIQAYYGSAWHQLLNEDNSAGAITNIREFQNRIYICGNFGTLNGREVPGQVAQYNNGVYVMTDANLDISGGAYDTLITRDGALWVAGAWTGTAITSPTIAAANPGTYRAYPRITITGPCKLWQIRNYTTGKILYFWGLTIQAGEVATLNLDPRKRFFWSSWRGSLMKYIAPASDLDWYLLGGSNNIAAHLSGTAAATSAIMTWAPRYWTIDEAML